MGRLDLKFLLIGATILVGGVGLGIYMGITHNFQLTPVHAHANLVGFVSMTLFGVVYRLFPELQHQWMAKAHFLLAAPAAIVFPVGIALAVLAQQPLMAIVAAFMWLIGAILFLIQLAGLAFGRTAAPAE